MKKGRKDIHRNLFEESWLIVRNNKILFVPNFIILLINLGLFILFLWLTGLDSSLIENNFNKFIEIFSSWNFWIYFCFYLMISMLIDNFFLTIKYGLIKDILIKGKARWKNGLSFAKRYYWTSLGIHIISSLIVIVPLFLLAVVLFLLLPTYTLIAVTIFIPLMIIYLVYIAVRLLFVYPIMTFEQLGAYKSIKEDFHFVKTHLHHTMITWLIVIGISIVVSIVKENFSHVTDLMIGQLFFMGLILATIIIGIEIAVSVWEHVFIFKSYLAGKKR